MSKHKPYATFNMQNGILFFAIVRAIIDVKKGKLTFEIGQEKVEFNLFKLTK